MSSDRRRLAARPAGTPRGARLLVAVILAISSGACTALTATPPATAESASPSPPSASSPSSFLAPAATPAGPAATTAARAATSPGSAPSASVPVPGPARSLGERLGCADRTGTLVDVSYQSAVAGDVERYRLYLPPCFAEAGRRYPYVVLMHGSVSDEREWTDALGLDAALDRAIGTGRLGPMIVVMPYGGELANYDMFAPGRSFEDVVLGEILPQVEGQHCGWASARERAIGGISRGGFWALEIGLRHPSAFAAIGAHSPYLYPEAGGPENNPLLLAGTAELPPHGPPRIWIDAGAQDYALDGIAAIAATLQGRDADVEYHLYPAGLHDEAYWAAHVDSYLAFYGRGWPRDVAALPRCRQ